MAFSHQRLLPSRLSFIEKMEGGDTVIQHTSLIPEIKVLVGSRPDETQDRVKNSGDSE